LNTPPSKAALRDELLSQVLPTVRAILKRKTGATLADDDTRRDNVDAIELYHEVITRVWERISTGDVNDVADVRAYAATVAHNAWSDYLRDKYPRRTSLKNRLRYFIEHQPKYALWQGATGEPMCGLRAFQFGSTVVPSERITALRDGREKIPELRLPGRAFEQFDGTAWDTLLDALFKRLNGPIALDDLIAVTVYLVGLKEDRVESIDDDEEMDEGIADSSLTPAEVAEMRSALARLWVAITKLKTDYRCAYLLNVPGPGKSRAEIEVFVINGIASIAQIGETIALDDSQFRIASAGLELEDEDRAAIELLRTPREQFFLLWKYLPLADLLIGRMLGLGQQQIINRRMLAMRELARAMRGEKNK
jgi:RNA polymerase sigma factor (sigma-70 family)